MNSKTDVFNLAIFVVLSVALHIAAGVALYFLAPVAKVAEEGPYVVRIVPLEPLLEPQAGEEKSPPQPEQQAALRRTKPPETEPPPKEFSSRPSTPAAPPKPLKEAGEAQPSADKEAEAAPARKTDEAVSEAPGMGDKLFDPDVLASAVEKGRIPKPPESSVTFDTKEIRHWGYMQRLKERIEYIWEYPQEAAARGIYGDLVIKFVIKEDGRLGAVELVRTSGWRDLDSAAIRALRDGAPYWPLPEEWGTGSLTVTGHFIYTIHGSYYLR